MLLGVDAATACENALDDAGTDVRALVVGGTGLVFALLGVALLVRRREAAASSRDAVLGAAGLALATCGAGLAGLTLVLGAR